MSKWNDTSTKMENNSTLSKDAITIKEKVVSDEQVVNTSNSAFDEDTKFEPFRNVKPKGSEKLNPTPPEIRVFDVAAYILENRTPMTTMKLQKLVYYSQAWSLVWDEAPLFNETIEAWANGPVVRELFDYHRGSYEISSIPIGNPRLLNKEQQETVKAVLEYYGDKSAQWLIELTHMEAPWIQARKGLPKLERGNRVISRDAMADYYSALSVEDDCEDEEEESIPRA